MKNSKNTPPKIGLFLLEICLPNSVKDEIIGDLHEQYYESEEPISIKQLNFWYQSAIVIWRCIMFTKKTLALALCVMSCAVLFICIAAITFISNSTDAEAFSKPYWTDGNFYQFFLDPILYSHISNNMVDGISPQLFINIPSILWMLGGIAIVLLLKKASKLNLQTIAVVSLVLLVGPYIWAVFSFKTNNVPLRESGPILAFMLINVVYLVVPLTILFIKEMFKEKIFA